MRQSSIFIVLVIARLFFTACSKEDSGEQINKRTKISKAHYSDEEFANAIEEAKTNPYADESEEGFALLKENLANMNSKELEKYAAQYGLKGDIAKNKLLIRFKTSNQKLAVRAVTELPVFGVAKAEFIRQFSSSGTILVKLPEKLDDISLIATAHFLDGDLVEYIEPDAVITRSMVPNDPRFAEQWGFHNTGQSSGKVDADIDAVEAWDITTGSKDVLVGVIDDGVYCYGYDFDLNDNCWTNPGESGTDSNGKNKSTNGKDDDGNGYIDDWRGWNFYNNNNNSSDDLGHGTHVAGTIGAAGNNRKGVAGLNWQVSIVPIKFIGANGGSLSGAISAIEYATKLGIKITNNSWGSKIVSETLKQAIRVAGDAGMLFIASAGNSASNNDGSEPSYPASYALDNIISVAATDRNDNLASFSCYGANSVHLAAPGVQILSTGLSTPVSLNGTSMAAPHVTGVAALIKAKYPSLSFREIKAKILGSVDPIPGLQGKVKTAGRLNAFNALRFGVSSPSGAWTNPDANRVLDVNNDKKITAIDALLVINYLNIPGSSVSSSGDLIGLPPNNQSYIDTNADGRLTAIDALRVINCLNLDSCVKVFP